MVFNIIIWKELKVVIKNISSIRDTLLKAEAHNLIGGNLNSKVVRRLEALASQFNQINPILEKYNSEKRNMDKVNSFLYLKIDSDTFGEIIDVLESKKAKLDYKILKELDITIKYHNYLVDYIDKHLGHIKL